MVSDRSGVEGRYFDLEQAKDILRSITSGAKLIAEVVDNNKLLTDPHVISGQPQVPESGFHKAWGDWSVILRLMDVAEKYLQNVEGMLNKIIFRLRYIFIYNVNTPILFLYYSALLFAGCDVSMKCEEDSYCYNGYCMNKKGNHTKTFLITI